MAISSKNGHMAIWPFDHMAPKMANMRISGNSYKNAAIWWRNQVDWNFLQEMRAIMVWRQIFWCIFRNFLCLYRKWWSLKNTLLKLLIPFALTFLYIKAAICLWLFPSVNYCVYWDTLIHIEKINKTSWSSFVAFYGGGENHHDAQTGKKCFK